MRICLDATALDTAHKYRGIGNYVGGLLKGFSQISERLDIRFLRLRHDSLGTFRETHTKTVFIRRPKKPSIRFQWLLNELILGREIAHLKMDILHSTRAETLVHRKEFMTVATAYDLIQLFYPTDYFSLFSIDKKLSFKISLCNYTKANHIIAISECTKNDFVKHLGIDPKKISVIYPGFDKTLFNCERSLNDNDGNTIPKKYFLYVGSSERRKNSDAIIEAYAMVAGKLDEDLVFVGKATDGENRRTIAKVEKLGISGRFHKFDFVKEEELPTLYARATAFVFPSLYEGFGLPALEAMACGCPVIASNTSSLPEVVGDAGILIDPLHTEGFAQAMEKVAGDAVLRNLLKEKGINRARMFDWEASAEQIIKVYENLQ